jgi:hypothetical protein
MVFGALIFFIYAVVFLFRAFSGSGFEIGVETLNGVTPQQLDGINPAIMAYIMHRHCIGWDTSTMTGGATSGRSTSLRSFTWWELCWPSSGSASQRR